MAENNHFDLRRGLFWPRSSWGVSVSRGPADTARANWQGGSAIAGGHGKALVGAHGFAKVGYRGVASGGNFSTAFAGCEGTAIAGEGGRICIDWYDRRTSRYRIATGYVGEDGIQAHVAYKVDPATGDFVPA